MTDDSKIPYSQGRYGSVLNEPYEKRIDYSKIKKAPTPEHLKYKFVPIEISKEQFADSAKFIDFVQVETDLVIAEQQRRVMDYLAKPSVFIREPSPLLAGLGTAAHKFTLPPNTPIADHHATACTTCGEKWGAHYGFSCDPVPWDSEAAQPADPLDVKHDSVTLRELLANDRDNCQRDRLTGAGGALCVALHPRPARGGLGPLVGRAARQGRREQGARSQRGPRRPAGRAVKTRVNARMADDHPRFPICWMGREGCSLLGFHGHLSPLSEVERERVQRWRATADGTAP